MSEKRISPNKFTDLGRENGRKKANEVRRKDSFDDGLTSVQRRQKAIKKAANGKWWIEQYIQASLYWRDPDEMRGIDDE
tara:strand:+ start:588 stop:824 length:237 start_codon:yes stop_codon:yes gene_type:complete